MAAAAGAGRYAPRGNLRHAAVTRPASRERASRAGSAPGLSLCARVKRRASCASIGSARFGCACPRRARRDGGACPNAGPKRAERRPGRQARVADCARAPRCGRRARATSCPWVGPHRRLARGLIQAGAGPAVLGLHTGPVGTREWPKLAGPGQARSESEVRGVVVVVCVGGGGQVRYRREEEEAGEDGVGWVTIDTTSPPDDPGGKLCKVVEDLEPGQVRGER
jgi:hypothetical protein